MPDIIIRCKRRQSTVVSVTFVPYTNKLLAVHRDGKQWTITHVKCGWAVTGGIRTKRSALELAEWMYSLLSSRARKLFDTPKQREVVSAVPEHIRRRWVAEWRMRRMKK